MPNDVLAYSLSNHPAPYRERIGLTAILYGLFAAPIVWAGHLMVNYGIVGHACYPGDKPLPPGGPTAWMHWLLLGLDILTLVLIASGALVSFRNWRVTGPPESHQHHLMEVGEGRTRYLAICGMGFSVMFFLITATDTVALAFLPLCTR
jgi:hypothetical protein